MTEKILSFTASAGIALTALVAAAGAFFVACTASLTAFCFAASTGSVKGNTEQTIFMTCLIICGAASLAAFIGIFWLMRPRPR